jgi:hypothetical protein
LIGDDDGDSRLPVAVIGFIGHATLPGVIVVFRAYCAVSATHAAPRGVLMIVR